MILFPRTALGTKHESRIWRAGLRPGAYTCFLWELPEEAHVILEKHLNIVDAVLQHREAVDADAEGEAADFFRVVIHEAVDGGIDHARAEEFNPRGALAFRARSAAGGRTCSAAKWAGDVELDGRLGEREIAWPEARFHAGTKKLFYEIFDGAREIAKGNVGVHGEAFDLVKGEGMRGVGIVAAIDLAGNVEGFEIVIGCFDFGAFDDGEADGEENVFDFLEDLTDQVMRADGADDAGKREVLWYECQLRGSVLLRPWANNVVCTSKEVLLTDRSCRVRR